MAQRTYRIYPAYKRKRDGKVVEHVPYSHILAVVFAERADWVEVAEGGGPVDYSDKAGVGRVLNKFQATENIIRKCYLATVMSGCLFYPTTYVVINRRISKNYRPQRGKWFLKMDKGWGGLHVNVMRDSDNWRRLAKRGSSYVLQRSVEDLLLYNGRKFDIRTYYLIYFRGRDYWAYLFHDSKVRITTNKYVPDSTNPSNNITNKAFQEQQSGYSSKSNNTNFRSLECYDLVFPQIVEASKEVFKRIRGEFRANNGAGFEVMGFDFLPNAEGKPHLLEINRNCGFNHYHEVNDFAEDMMRDAIDLAIVPALSNAEPGPEGRFVEVGHWSV